MESTRAIDRQVLIEVLFEILPQLQRVLRDGDYRLVGTAAALLAGCDLPVDDVDFLMRDQRHVDAFAAALSGYDCLVSPRYQQWSPPPQEAGQYWCRYSIGGVHVEASTVEVVTNADCLEVSGTGPWTHYVNLDVGAYCVPTIRIELRLATELSRNRVGKAEPIIEWMMKNGGDLGLLQRAMQACGVPLERQDDVLTELRRSRRNHG
ncbi:MAG TPA: hypothetical protein GXZ82_13480 [Firmicutes bacterium]|jgi:hypothetical protein|nr:hypothetical protein [Bacillota bacterium]